MNKYTKLLGGLLTLGAGSLTASSAYAVTDFRNCNGTFGSIVSNINSQAGPIVTLVMILSTLLGLWLVVSGLRQFVTEHGQQNSTIGGILKLLSGGLLTSIGTTYVVVGTTLFGTQSTSATGLVGNFGKASAKCAMTGQSASSKSEMVGNLLIDLAQPLLGSAFVFSVIMGLVIIIHALVKLGGTYRGGSVAHNFTTGNLIARILIGAALINLPFFIDSVNSTMFSATTANASIENCSILSYGKNPVSHTSETITSLQECVDKQDPMKDPATYMAATYKMLMYGLIPFGVIAIISALIMLMNATGGGNQSQGASIKSAFVRLIAGAIMINMQTFTCSAYTTMMPSEMLKAQSPMLSAFSKICVVKNL